MLTVLEVILSKFAPHQVGKQQCFSSHTWALEITGQVSLPWEGCLTSHTKKPQRSNKVPSLKNICGDLQQAMYMKLSSYTSENSILFFFHAHIFSTYLGPNISLFHLYQFFHNISREIIINYSEVWCISLRNSFTGIVRRYYLTRCKDKTF